MYWFWPKKGYDPRPYSRLLAAWHWTFGCPVSRVQPSIGPDRVLWLRCPCGIAWEIGRVHVTVTGAKLLPVKEGK